MKTGGLGVKQMPAWMHPTVVLDLTTLRKGLLCTGATWALGNWLPDPPFYANA